MCSTCRLATVLFVRLTTFTDLALRVVLRLASAGEAERLGRAALAAAVGAPGPHVAEALDRLRQLDVVAEDGGLTLTGSALETSIGWLVRELEGTGEVVGCHDDQPCPLVFGCRLRGALRVAQEAFFASLDPITVRDLTAGGHQWLSPPVTVRS